MTYWHRWTSCTPRRFYPRSAGHTHIVAIQFFPTWRQIMRATAGDSGSSGIFILFLSRHDVTCMAHSPPLLRQIYTYIQRRMWREKERQKERGRTPEKTTFCYSFNFFCDGDYQNANRTYIIHTRTVQYITKQSNRFTTALPHLLLRQLSAQYRTDTFAYIFSALRYTFTNKHHIFM